MLGEMWARLCSLGWRMGHGSLSRGYPAQEYWYHDRYGDVQHSTDGAVRDEFMRHTTPGAGTGEKR